MTEAQMNLDLGGRPSARAILDRIREDSRDETEKGAPLAPAKASLEGLRSDLTEHNHRPQRRTVSLRNCTASAVTRR